VGGRVQADDDVFGGDSVFHSEDAIASESNRILPYNVAMDAGEVIAFECRVACLSSVS
jgi:hypothetical protein